MKTTIPLAIDLPVTALSGVGDRVAKQLAQLDIQRVFDLLLHLPRDYEDRSRLVLINELQNGQSALVEGKIIKVDTKKNGMTVIIHDGSAQMSLRFFKVYATLVQTMVVGRQIRCFGEVKISRYGIQMFHPEYQLADNMQVLENSGLQPIYPTVKGLHQNKLRTLIKMALQWVRQQNISMSAFTQEDWQSVAHLPISQHLTTDKNTPPLTNHNIFEYLAHALQPVSHEHHIQALQSLSLFEALTLIHTPPIYADIKQQMALITQMKERTHLAYRRLIIEEFTAHQLSLLIRRQKIHQNKAPRCEKTSILAKQLLDNLPFQLTNAQLRVIDEIVNDMATSIPMLRLVQGDVGAGKTLVAALAACHALDSGWQVALMAPTEILAEQHFLNFQKWFEPLKIGVGWLAGKQTAKARRESLQAVIDNEVQVVIGTHALFQDKVEFAKLGLVIIDEQHRFGVEQRMALTNKGASHCTPHQLVMTATPIPRTLAMSAYGDMDTSIIDELPPNRTAIKTVTIDRIRRDEVIERIAINCHQGKQAYWVCPLVEESTALDAQAAQATYEDLCARLDIRIGLVHGKMKANEKQAVMRQFKTGEISLLVATTVIEVGVDVPNASLMVIENAERLGLSQLHQLRGRVGRGSQQSFCVLLYQTPLSETGIERLNVLRDSSNGFVIAQKDLQLRGPGELLGKRQTGNMGYYVSDLIRDESLLVIAQQLARRLLADENRKNEVHQLIDRWLPNAQKYSQV